MKIKKVNSYSYEIAKEGDMKVPLRVFASEKLFEKLKEDNSLQQGINVAGLPGIQGKSLMMPDAHYGYGFSIGGVAAFDSETGIISPGGIGFDINCGVRVLSTPLKKDEVEPKIKELLENMFKSVPSGVGSESKIRLDDDQLFSVLESGAHWAEKNGFGTKEDLAHCESTGKLPSADPTKVSARAKKRGRKQLGTLGAGNHFLEVQVVEKIFDKEVADIFGISFEGQILVMIHTGSRGLGHQVCSDYLRQMEDTYPDIVAKLPEKDLIYAPIQSQLAKDYFGAMSAAANYAWANRHIIGHYVRKAFKDTFKTKDLKTIYDVAHNIAKLEEHEIDGKMKKVYVHRKGATRAFPPGSEEIPEDYKKVGQPILIPGSMGTASYILVGTQKAMSESFGSTAHGAGRMLSRFAAKKQFDGETIRKDLEKKGIFIRAASVKGVVEEAPAAYKDVDEVVKVSDDAGIGKLVVKLRPLGVVKG